MLSSLIKIFFGNRDKQFSRDVFLSTGDSASLPRGPELKVVIPLICKEISFAIMLTGIAIAIWGPYQRSMFPHALRM